nr:hypothetical protein [Tanacetum cinerariifolium]
MSEEVFQAKGDLMKSIRTFLEKFNRYPFGEKPKILLQAWEKFFEIQHAQPEDTNELFQRILEDLQIIREELSEYINSPSWNYPTFYDDTEEHYVQYKEYLEKSPDAIAPILSTKEPKYSLSMGYEHLNTTPKMESDEIIKSGVEKLVPIPNECEDTSEDKRKCDVLVCKDSSSFEVCDDHSEILSDSNDDDISSDDDAFEDVEHVEASPLDSELVSLEDGNDVHQEDEDLPLHFLSLKSLIILFQIILHPNSKLLAIIGKRREVERLTSIVMNDISDDSTNDLLLEEVGLFFASDNLIPPGSENFGYDSEGDIRFLKESLVDDPIPLPENKSSNFNHQNDPLFPRPPPKPPDVEFDFNPNSGEVISAAMNDNDELECFDAGDKINVFTNVEDDDYFFFIFVILIFLPYLIYPEIFPLLLFAKSEDTIFDPGISV